jgi:hypothetical protein
MPNFTIETIPWQPGLLVLLGIGIFWLANKIVAGNTKRMEFQERLQENLVNNITALTGETGRQNAMNVEIISAVRANSEGIRANREAIQELGLKFEALAMVVDSKIKTGEIAVERLVRAVEALENAANG